MEIQDHHSQFRKIIKKYGLEKKAEAIAHEIAGKTVTVSDFAQSQGMTVKEAQTFLSFLQRGIDFKMRCLK